MTDPKLTEGFPQTPEQSVAGFEKLTMFDESLEVVATASSDPLIDNPAKLYHELRARSKDSMVSKDERNIAHREAERLYELHLDDQARQHEKDWEAMTKRSLTDLSNVIMNVGLPSSVRHVAAKEFLCMEAFAANNYPQHWKEANDALRKGLYPLGYKRFIEDN